MVLMGSLDVEDVSSSLLVLKFGCTLKSSGELQEVMGAWVPTYDTPVIG